MSEPAIIVNAEDQPSWNEVVRHAEHGELVSVMAHGEHVADIVPSGELDRLPRRQRMSGPAPYTIAFTPAARRGLDKLPLAAATALYEHLAGPVAENPHRLGKPLDEPFDEVRTTRRGEYRAASASN